MMDEKRAREILGGTVRDDGQLIESTPMIRWHPLEAECTLDGDFSADELEAIAWWMRNKRG